MARFRSPSPGLPLVVVEPDHEPSLDQVDRAEVISQYKAHGALLFHGFRAGLEEFNRLARDLCATAVVNESPGRLPLDPQRSLYNVDGGDRAFALHPEMSREPWKPDLAMFCCLSPPGEGGRTTACDGIALARALPPHIREGLEGRRLIYLKAAWPSLLQYWLGTETPSDDQLRNPPPGCPYALMRLNDGRVARYFSRPALHKPMFADELAFGNFLLFARFNNNQPNFPLLDDYTPVPGEWLEEIKAIGDRLSVAVTWQKGDLLLLDNTRFMHGRTAITDPGERIIATYFGYLKFALPNPEEPADPIWRREDFEPPRPPDHMVRAR